MSSSNSLNPSPPHETTVDPGNSLPWSSLTDWLKQASDLIEEAAKGLRPEPVHDLRVTLRRCRSAAIGFEQLDPSPAWRRLRKESKRLLQGLGDLRDVQVMHRWISRMGMAETESGRRLLGILLNREARAIRQARKELKEFDRKQWRKWARDLPDRARRIPANSPALELLVLQQWTAAYELHRAALHLRSKVSFHRLRIGLKNFRYSVEFFAPERHASWGRELKRLQDYLGEVHDLDVLWAAVTHLRPVVEESERSKWLDAINKLRKPRLAAYLEKMAGAPSRWEKWRAELPSGLSLENGRLNWLAVWASFLDPDPQHSRRVAKLATQLFDGVRAGRGLPRLPRKARDLLEAAAIMRDVGRAEGDRHHQKTSYRLIRNQNPPPGWSHMQMARIACVARFHRGRLPRHAGWEGWHGIPEKDREGLKLLGGILRLAATLAGSIEPRVNGAEAGRRGDLLLIRAAGYRSEEPLASRLAEARHLLESAVHRPVVIEPAN
jgi:CHAD domain-containing protein